MMRFHEICALLTCIGVIAQLVSLLAALVVIVRMDRKRKRRDDEGGP